MARVRRVYDESKEGVWREYGGCISNVRVYRSVQSFSCIGATLNSFTAESWPGLGKNSLTLLHNNFGKEI